MKPVKFDGAEIVYRGPSEEIGDLWCERLRPGLIKSVWDFTDAEREIIANGGRVELLLFNEPIPPISLNVLTAEQSTPVGEHGWKGQRVGPVDPDDDPEPSLLN